MRLEIWDKNFSLQWGGTYFLALVDYPNIQDWEIEKIHAFIAYEKYNNRITQVVCKDEAVISQLKNCFQDRASAFPFFPTSKVVASTYDAQGNCVYSDFLSHTCTIDTAKDILKSGRLLSAVKAFHKTPTELVRNVRNVAGDPKDYFDYVMFAWSNTTSGYQLAMERLLGRMPTNSDLNEYFTPGVSFHFLYDDIVKLNGYVFDGYHAAKVKDSVDLDILFACIVPTSEKANFKTIIPSNLLLKTYYLDYQQEGLIEWSAKVYKFVETLASSRHCGLVRD